MIKYLICILICILLCIIVGASYIPPWKLFKKPYVYLWFGIIFLGIFAGTLIYSMPEVRKWLCDLILR